MYDGYTSSAKFLYPIKNGYYTDTLNSKAAVF